MEIQTLSQNPYLLFWIGSRIILLTVVIYFIVWFLNQYIDNNQVVRYLGSSTLFTILFIISWQWYFFNTSFSFINTMLIIFIMYCYILCVLYVFLYTWRNLSLCPSSLFFFSVFMSILLVYLIGIFRVLKGIPDPIYLENLSLFSIYRYTLFAMITMIGIFLYVIFTYTSLANYSSKLLPRFHFLVYPYLKEEFRKVLSTWDDGTYYISFTNTLVNSKVNRYLFFFSHFLVFYLFRLICIGLLFNFAFFSLDLRYVIYLIPISFIIWLLRFLDYCYYYFFKSTETFFHDVLNITSVTDVTSHEKKELTVFRTPEELVFNLTPIGYEEGYSDKDLPYLSNRWFTFIQLQVPFLKYKKFTSYFSYLFLFSNITYWLAIIVNSDHNLLTAGWISLFSKIPKRNFSVSHPLLARDARWVNNEKDMNVLKEKTKGNYSPGHMVYDEEVYPKTYRVDGSLITSESPKGLDLGITASNGKPQKYIPTTPIEMPTNALSKPVPGSETALETPKIKEKLDAYKDPKEHD